MRKFKKGKYYMDNCGMFKVIGYEDDEPYIIDCPFDDNMNIYEAEIDEETLIEDYKPRLATPLEEQVYSDLIKKIEDYIKNEL